MSWTRRTLTALAVCVLLPLGAAGCGAGEAHGHGGAVSPSPVGKVLDDTDDTGRHLREVGKKHAPDVAIEVTPDPTGGWDVRLTLRHFRLSPAGAQPKALPARGLVHLLVDGRLVSRLRTHAYHLADRLVPHGTHHVTARLYADDGTVWAVHGRPVESTADITASGAETDPAATRSGAVTPSAKPPLAPAATTMPTAGR